jgi:hypothetical protein
MFEKIKNYYRSLNIKKEKLAPFLVFLVIIVLTSLFFGISKATPAMLFIVLAILCLITSIMAGIVVFRSLIIASVSLTFLVFLGQTYCGLPVAAQTANDALATLMGFGFFYSIGVFIVSLYKELWGDKELNKKGSFNKIKEIYEGKVPWTILVPYALFIGIFLVDLYRVINPIIRSLCIYK